MSSRERAHHHVTRASAAEDGGRLGSERDTCRIVARRNDVGNRRPTGWGGTRPAARAGAVSWPDCQGPQPLARLATAATDS